MAQNLEARVNEDGTFGKKIYLPDTNVYVLNPAAFLILSGNTSLIAEDP